MMERGLGKPRGPLYLPDSPLMLGLNAGDKVLEARDGSLLSDIISPLPVLGPLLKPFLEAQCSDPNSAQAASSDPAALQRLQDAVGTVSSALTGLMPTGVPVVGLPLPVPSGMPNAPGGAPTGAVPIFGAKGVDSDSDPSSPAASPSDTLSPGLLILRPTAPTAAPCYSPHHNHRQRRGRKFCSSRKAYLSAGDAGAPTSAGVPSGPPNTPVPVNSAPVVWHVHFICTGLSMVPALYPKPVCAHTRSASCKFTEIRI